MHCSSESGYGGFRHDVLAETTTRKTLRGAGARAALTKSAVIPPQSTSSTSPRLTV
jgi:hypothetical protein